MILELHKFLLSLPKTSKNVMLCTSNNKPNLPTAPLFLSLKTMNESPPQTPSVSHTPSHLIEKNRRKRKNDNRKRGDTSNTGANVKNGDENGKAKVVPLTRDNI